MKLLVLIFATFFVLTAAQSASGIFRFLVTPKTITSTVTTTVTSATTTRITKVCVTSNSSLTNCRRRRNAIESPMILEDEDGNALIDPSSLVMVETTPYPEARAIVPAGNSVPIGTEGAVSTTAIQPSIENTAGMAEVQIHDLENICKSRAANPFMGVGLAQIFGITVLFSTTVTNTATTMTTVTAVSNQTNTFFIGGCLPSPFLFSTC